MQTLNIGAEGTVRDVIQSHLQLAAERCRTTVRERGDDSDYD